MRHLVLIVLLCMNAMGAAALETPATKELSDEEVAARIANVACMESPRERVRAYLFEMCRSDSNRLCNIAVNVFWQNPQHRVREEVLSVIHSYGGVTQLPFLESCVTNVWHGRSAMRVLNHIDGFTSNSVYRMARYHAATNQEVFAVDTRVYSERTESIEDLIEAAKGPEVNAALKNLAREYVWSFVSNNCYHICTVDRVMCDFDPSYKTSKRRLALLRYAQPRAPEPFRPAYVADEIRKLEAYPEASLPE